MLKEVSICCIIANQNRREIMPHIFMIHDQPLIDAIFNNKTVTKL